MIRIGRKTPREILGGAFDRLAESRAIYYVPALIFVLYAFWMIGPYLYSTVIRDATVTTWSHLASAPIFGTIQYANVRVNSRIPEDGIIARMSYPLASREALERAKLRISLAEARVAQQSRYLDAANKQLQLRLQRRDRYGDQFNALLNIEAAQQRQELGIAKAQLTTLEQIVARQMQLAERSMAPLNEVDQLTLQIYELRERIVQLDLRLATTEMRRKAGLGGVYLAADGGDPDWVAEDLDGLVLEQKKAELALANLRSELEVAQAEFLVEQADYQRRSFAEIKLQPGSFFWRELISTGTNVTAGQTVAEWIDCDNLLIDVPLSDAEVSLLAPRDGAEVVLEGEKITREAYVLFTRGAAATLGREDIAALAKSRNDEDVAQAILVLPSQPDEFSECPVGLAAYVRFPNVGVVDVIRTRLRL